MKVAEWVATIRSRGVKRPTLNERGNQVIHLSANTGRYIVDFADDFTGEGWVQFDTDQDAGYFGVWMNPGKLLTMSYAEGDWYLVECPDAAHYDAEVMHACTFYGAGFIAKTIDAAGDLTTFVQDRRQFFISPPAQEPVPCQS